MKISAVSLKDVMLGCILTFAANVGLSLAAAVLIYKKLLPYSSGEMMSVLTITAASLLGGFVCVKRSGIQMTGYAVGCIVVLLLVLSGFVMLGSDISMSAITKTAVAVFVGIFLGNFFGKMKHNKLRKNRKKRYSYTK